MVYYASFKLTNDRIAGLPNLGLLEKKRRSRSDRRSHWRLHAKVSCIAH